MFGDKRRKDTKAMMERMNRDKERERERERERESDVTIASRRINV